MAARTFTDSAGLTWDVFEVHRASTKEGAVSPGLEQGWLAFASGEQKRRLAPFPSEWVSSTDAELEALCDAARPAAAPRYPLDRPLRPRIRRTTTDDAHAPAASPAGATEQGSRPSNDDEPLGEPAFGDPSSSGATSEVEATVRGFAHDARARNLPAVAAMLELKTLLQERHPDPDSPARDRKLVRRWFVESYYFARNA